MSSFQQWPQLAQDRQLQFFREQGYRQPVWGMQRNPDRRWWQLWRPRWIAMSDAQCAEMMR